MLRRIEKRLASNVDWSLFAAMLGICVIGLIVLYSAGYNPDTGTSSPMKKQAFAMGVGLVGFFTAMFMNINFWRRWAYAMFVVGCLLLAAILGMGVVAGGARRWLDLGPFRMQPSEMMKLGIIFLFARLFTSDKAPTSGFNLTQLILPAGILLVPVGLTLKQPDLGTALCQLLIGASMIYAVGVRPRTALTLFIGGVGAAVPAWEMLKPYQRNRILNFLTPDLDPLGSGYHAIQSKIAVGSGAMTGKGLLHGTQTQLRFLPEQTTDFIFSCFAEEWGFVGSAVVIALYSFLIYRIYKVCSRTEDKFAVFVCFGVGAMFFWQVVVNIGMVTGSLPVVGITLPLLSYGGSSVVTLMVGLGLVSGISGRRFLFA